LRVREIRRDSIRILRGLLIVTALLFLPGCLMFGRRQTDQPVVPENVDKVKKGMEKREVTRLLGAPQEIIFSNKEHDPLVEHAYIYEYKVDKMTGLFFLVVNFGNLDSKRDRAIIFFNEKDQVVDVAKTLNGNEARYGFPFGR